MRKILNITGYGNSGKSAISDFLKEFTPVFSFNNRVEFELFRVPDGLVDLYHSLYGDYGLIRSDMALKRFKSLIKRIGTTQSLRNPITYFTASAYNYDKLFNNKFIFHADQYVKDLIIFEYDTYWPYKYNYLNSFELFYEKVRRKLGISKENAIVYFANKKNFTECTQRFVQNLFDSVALDNQNIVLLNNSFDSYNPSICHEIVGDGYSIIVERDPRDIYASILSSNDLFVPAVERDKKSQRIKKQMLGNNDINSFISRYRSIRENASYDDDRRILRLKFEDFVINHQKSSEEILGFLELSESDWSRKKQFFDSEKSIKNIGVWKKYKDNDGIKKIESELSNYCYQS